MGDGKVVHYGALMYDIIRKPVEEVTLAAFAEGRPVFVVMHAEAAFDAAEVIRRARSRLGEKRYRLLTNNCEHFVEWCLHDVHRSFEVETALNFPRWFGERILAALFSGERRCPRNPQESTIPAPRAPTRACDAAAARALRRRISSKRCCVLVGFQFRRSVRPMGRTTLPAG